MSAQAVRQLRVVLITEDLDQAVGYYRDALGLTETTALSGPDGAQVVILDAGRATLELANPEQARFIAAVETGGVPSSPVRLAFEVADTGASTEAMVEAGSRLIAAPVRTPWNSLNSRLDGPAEVQVTLFQELAPAQDDPALAAARLVGAGAAELGGEAGLLARTVELAGRHGRAGHLPFAALTVRDGVVIGAGLNATLATFDPSAHGEVAAIRDATARTGSPDLSGAVVYSSCEPCAICRTVAAAAGVREIVYAAAKELVPGTVDASPEQTAALIAAVTAVLPRIARAGDSGLSTAELTAPFQAWVEAQD